MKYTEKEFMDKFETLRDYKYEKGVYVLDEKNKKANCSAFITAFYPELKNLTEFKELIKTPLYKLQKIYEPQDFCLALMGQRKENESGYIHSGIYLNGYIFHMSNNGPMANKVITMQEMYRNITYFNVRHKKTGELIW